MFLTSVGTVLEYYDYVLFMELSYFMSYLFFPGNIQSAFYIFSLGYAARLIGGLLIGFVSYDKSKILKVSILLMSASTLAIAVMPTYHSIGIIATYIFVCMRFIQGISYAVEFPAAVSVASESKGKNDNEDNTDKNQSSKIGVIISSATVGAILANISSVLLVYFFTNEQIISVWWRLPFAISGILGLLLFKCRSFNNNSEEVFQSINILNLKNQVISIINAVKMHIFPSFLIIMYMYFPHFFKNHGYESLYFIYKYKLLILFSSIIFVTWIGKAMDKEDVDMMQMHKIFIVVWSALVVLSSINKYGVALLMLFTQFSIAFAMHCSLKNLLKQNKESIFISYNMSLFLASLIVPLITSWTAMIIVPLALSSLFALNSYIENIKN